MTQGTATSLDFNEVASQEVTFNSGDTTKVVGISIFDDGVVEASENFTVTLESSHPRVVLNRRVATVVITDGDGTGFWYFFVLLFKRNIHSKDSHTETMCLADCHFGI